ncbi:MAG: type II toxin-antitoxin system HicB family antitoxin [Pseudomonadota bacterium]
MKNRRATMEQPVVSFTAVYLKNKHGYTGFVEELPGVNSHGLTLEEARDNLKRQAQVVFDAERAQAEELLEGKDVVREQFRVAVPRL